MMIGLIITGRKKDGEAKTAKKTDATTDDNLINENSIAAASQSTIEEQPGS